MFLLIYLWSGKSHGQHRKSNIQVPEEQVSDLYQEISILFTYGCVDGDLTIVLKSYMWYGIFTRSQDLLAELMKCQCFNGLGYIKIRV